MTLFQNQLSKKLITLTLIICLIGLTVGPILLYPRKAQAQCPVQVVTDIPKRTTFSIETLWEGLKKIFRAGNLVKLAGTLAEKIWDNAQKLVEWSFGVFLNLLLHQILAQLTNDIVNWIQNGTTPRFLSMGLDDWIGMAVDNAVGAFIDQYLGAGWLCKPFDLDIKIALLDVPTFEEKVRCSLSDIVGNINDFYDNFSKGGWAGWVELTKPRNNFYGAYLLAQAEKLSVKEIAERETEKELEMGQGYFSPKDCYWYDAHGNLVIKQTNVWGIPPLPEACKPDPANPGKTIGGFASPCRKRCQILTPASSVKNIADKAMTNYWDQLNAQIAGAVAKSGPFAVYVQAIVNALINRILTEGMGLLKATAVPIPDYGDIGESNRIPEVVNPKQVMKNKRTADALSTQLNLIKRNLENQLLEEQKKNLAVLKLIHDEYLETIPILDDVIANCSSTPYVSYVAWAQDKKDEIENTLIPSLDQRISQLEADIAQTIETINDVNTALVSIQDYINKADAWLEVYKRVEGKRDDPELKKAETVMKTAENKAIANTQKVLKAINRATYSTDFAGLEQEAQNANSAILTLALNLEEERGNPRWPESGTLYAKLERAQKLKNKAERRRDQCPSSTSTEL
jgi:uncharacterized coiled-coil protein SlyX